MRHRIVWYLCLGFVVAGSAYGQGRVTQLKFNFEPNTNKVRPFDYVQVQVIAMGEIGAGEARQTGRLRRAGAKVQIKEQGGGWLSKPFKFQGKDEGGFIAERRTMLGSIFEAASTQYVLQDAVLYVAPQTPGKYTIQAELDGVKGEAVIEVGPDSPAAQKPESVNFPPENRGAEPYRALAEYYAPMLAQETWFTPKADYATRFDFDGDWIGDNNWENLEQGTAQAYVHYAVMETETHWFLIYNVFHPRDYSDKCAVGSCHENDNEGMIFAVYKDGTPFGKLQCIETLAHNNIYSYSNESGMSRGLHSLEGGIDLYNGSHPVVFIESGGHGIYGGKDSVHARFDLQKDQFNSGIGVTYVYKGVAERPKHPNDRLVGYELLPIFDHWWTRMKQTSEQRIFDEFRAYTPYSGRPGVKAEMIATTFWGRKESANKAKPFWGWHDNRSLKEKAVAVGQWGLDPAYSMSRNLKFPAKYSLEYVYNPYLGIENGARTEPAAGSAPVVISAGTAQVGAPGTAQVAAPETPPAAAPGTAQVAAPETPPAAAPETPPAAAPTAVTQAVIALPAGQSELAGILPIVIPADGAPRGSRYGDAPESRYGAAPELRYGAAPQSGECLVMATVDGSAAFHIQASSLRVEVLSGQAVQDQQMTCTGALPSAASQVGVEKKAGRGTVKVQATPAQDNGFTASVRIDDSSRGADKYQFKITWKQ